jgi:hypothetical protein
MPKNVIHMIQVEFTLLRYQIYQLVQGWSVQLLFLEQLQIN